MASASSDDELQSASEVQEHMDHVPSKDLADSNSSEQEPFQEDDKPSPRIVLERSNFPTASQPSTCVLIDFLECFHGNPLHSMIPIENLCNEETTLEELSEKICGVFDENLIVTSLEKSDGELLPDEMELIQPSVSEETRSNEVIQPSVSEETRSNEVIQPSVSEETRSNEVIQLAVSEKTERTEKTQPDISEETESTEVIKVAFSEETASTKVTQLAISEETASTEVIQSAISEETGSTDVIQSAISEETRLNNTIQSPLDSLNLPSSNTEKVQILPDVIISSAVRKISSERFPGNTNHLLNSGKHSDFSQVAAKDTDNSTLLQDSEEFKNGTRFVVSGSDCGGHVIESPSTVFCPIIPNFEMPPVSLHSENFKFNSSSPDINSKVPKSTSSKTSLFTLLSILVDWINTGVDKVFNRSETANIADILDYAEKEFEYGLDVLKLLQKRIGALLRAAAGIPVPPSSFPCRLSGERNLFRDDLFEAGAMVWRRLEMLESGMKEDYDRFITVCRNDSELKDEKFDVNQLKAMALNMICNSYVKVSEDFSTLNLEIENFRNKIRDFCLDVNNFL